MHNVVLRPGDHVPRIARAQGVARFRGGRPAAFRRLATLDARPTSRQCSVTI
jgi:hypothetical protein